MIGSKSELTLLVKCIVEQVRWATVNRSLLNQYGATVANVEPFFLLIDIDWLVAAETNRLGRSRHWLIETLIGT